MAAGDLVSLQQALAWLGQTVDTNGFIAAMVSAVSMKIQGYVGYQFAEASYTRTFNGVGGDRQLLPDRPVVAVTALSIDGITIPQSAGPHMTGFVNDDRFVYIRGNWYGFGVGHFCCGIQNVTVTYSAGYAAVPADVMQACLDWLKSAYAALGESGDPTLKAYRAGDTQIDRQNLLTKLNGDVLMLPPSIAVALQPYVRVVA